MTQSLPSAVANALGLDRKQVVLICRYGGLTMTDRHYKTRQLAIKAVKGVKLTLRQASEIWGLSHHAGMLMKHAASGRLRLRLANPGELPSKINPRLVTVAAMLNLMGDLDGFVKRQRGQRG